MYLASVIDEVLESKKHKLVGRNSYYYIVDVLNRAFKNKEPYRFRFETYDDYFRHDYSISGLYDMDDNVKYIIFNFPKSCKTFTVSEKTWKEFKFNISQVCQHELIHQCQWSFRDPSAYGEKEPLEFRNRDESDEEEMEYLADPDEIEAYAHDIAMEIKFYYPKKDPYTVLRDINKHKKLWSYVYYRKTFKGEDWSCVQKRLYKKIFRWIPEVTV